MKKKSARSGATSHSQSRERAAATHPGEAAYEKLSARLASIPADRVVQPRADVRAAAAFVLSDTAGRLKDAALRARFASLPGTEFDHSALEDLVPAAQAALWAQSQLAVDAASATTPRLPLDLIDDSTGLRGRMLDVCDYHFKGDPDLERQVDDIRAGAGYLDLAEDLDRLGALYTQNHQLLKQDLRFYQQSDAEHALALSQRISSELRMQPGRTQAAREVSWRTWALLQQLYGEVARGGKFLLREAGETAFPALNYVGRAPSRKSRAKPAADAPQPSDGPAPAAEH